MDPFRYRRFENRFGIVCVRRVPPSKRVEKVVHAVAELRRARVPACGIRTRFGIGIACQRLAAVLAHVRVQQLHVWTMRVREGAFNK